MNSEKTEVYSKEYIEDNRINAEMENRVEK